MSIGLEADNNNSVKEFGRPPAIDFADEVEYHWPAWENGMKMADLCGSLHDEYNTLRIPIQSQRDFFYDVHELATRAKDHDQFHRLMAERSQARFDEVRTALDHMSLRLILGQDRFPYDSGADFHAFLLSMSATNLVCFLDHFEDKEAMRRKKLARAAAASDPEHPLYIISRARAREIVAPSSEATPTHSTTLPDPSPPSSPTAPTSGTKYMSPASPPTSTSSVHDLPSPPESAPPPKNPLSPSRPSLRRTTRLRTHARRQTCDDVVKRNLRPRPAGLPQRKEPRKESIGNIPSSLRTKRKPVAEANIGQDETVRSKRSKKS